MMAEHRHGFGPHDHIDQSMIKISTETTIGEIVRALPATSRIFENLNIDYCCGGKKTIAEVCSAKGLDAATIVAMLAALDRTGNTSPTDADAMTLSELCDHIQQAHHAYLREELPRLDFMTRKVASVHGDHESRLFELRKTFETFNAEMTSHTNDEDERVTPSGLSTTAWRNSNETCTSTSTKKTTCFFPKHLRLPLVNQGKSRSAAKKGRAAALRRP
jgi:iron-sulfur cluster repair di-iron protein